MKGMVGIRLARNEYGFSVVEVSLVFVVIILLATAAGLVANNQTARQAQQLQPNVVQLGTAPSKPNVDPTTTTLGLNALGIDITVPNVIDDLTYAAPNPTNGGYGISTKTLTTDDANCIATGYAPPLGNFFKKGGQYPTNGSAPEKLVKQFGAYYISWVSPHAPCSTNASVRALANQEVLDLEDSFKTVEEAPPN